MELELKVREAFQSDVGRGIVRLDLKAMNALGVEVGDTIAIIGEKKAVARVWRTQVEERGIIRLDGVLRHNAGLGVDDTAKVAKIASVRADEIYFAPMEEGAIKSDFAPYLQERMINIPLMKGNSAVVDVMGKGLAFNVVRTSPSGVVFVDEETVVKIAKKPVKDVVSVGVRYEDIGGLKEEIEAIREMIEIPMKYPEVFKRLGISPPKGVLLLGPPGCGKTLLAKAVASESEAHFIGINGPEIVGSLYGQSEENLRNAFKEAKENAPAIIFIDEIDAIAPKREEVQGEVERRIVSQLLVEMDGLEARGDVVVLAATNIPNAIDPALRRPGRFDREIEIRIPDIAGRKEVFQIHTRGMPLEGVNIDEIVGMTYGFTGADIAALCREAAMKALRRALPEIKRYTNQALSKDVLGRLVIGKPDFMEALKLVEPSAIREIMSEAPTVRWEDIGGLEDVKKELIESVEWPIKHAESFSGIGITPPTGILLIGPPGCGKTLLAKAVASESSANFLSIKGPEIISKYVGESEKAIRNMFKRAKQIAPSILFFDELDSIANRRGSDSTNMTERVVDQIMVEMDDLAERHQCVVLGATNRPESIDPGLLRPGRFEKILFVPMPDGEARKKVFDVHLRKMPVAGDVKVDRLVSRTEGYTSADISAICREAGLFSLRENRRAREVKMKHFEKSLAKIKPSMRKGDIERWNKLRLRY